MNNFITFREARLAAGLTYGEVAQCAGLGWTALAHYEAGRRAPSPDTLDRWRTALKQLLAGRASAIANHLATL
jgi:transcriptional regulator with XRE-family HTH domain